MQKTILLVTIAISFFATGCSSLQNSRERSWINFTNRPAHVVCWSGGKVVEDTITQGKVTDAPDSDGFFYVDADGSFIEINADCKFTYKK